MISYRLGDYRIVELENGELQWESYASFGRANAGQCFIFGNILFLEPYRKIDEHSYLIMEYYELLERLPLWQKTKYYCSGFTMRTCKTGRKPSWDEISSRSRERAERITHNATTKVSGSGGAEPKNVDEARAISYKLGHYEVVEDENGKVWWKAHAGLGRLKHGECLIEDDILLVEASSKVDLKKPGEPGFLRREFLQHLSQLPQWKKTKYYCSKVTIRTCKTGSTPPKNETSERSREQREGISRHVMGGMRSTISSFPRDDSRADFKEYIKRTKEQLVSVGAHLLSNCTDFWAKFFDRRQGRENRRDQKSGNRHDDSSIS